MESVKLKTVRFCAAAFLTILLYALTAVWIWKRQEYFVFYSLPFLALAAPLTAAIVNNLLLQPIKYRMLLHIFGIDTSYTSALKDRLVIISLKWITPLRIGEFVSYYFLTRNRGLDSIRTPAFFIIDKLLTVSAIAVTWFAALAGVLLGPIAFLPAAAFALLLFAVLSGSAATFIRNIKHPNVEKENPPSCQIRRTLFKMLLSYSEFGRLPLFGRIGVLSLSLGVELFELAGLALALSFSLKGGILSICILDVLTVQLISDLPFALGGSGSREAATLLIFRDRGEPQALFMSAFSVTLITRLLPTLIGLIYSSRLLKIGEPPKT